MVEEGEKDVEPSGYTCEQRESIVSSVTMVSDNRCTTDLNIHAQAAGFGMDAQVQTRRLYICGSNPIIEFLYI